MQYPIGIKAQGTKYKEILSGSEGRHMQYELNDFRCIGQQGRSHAILALNLNPSSIDS